MCHQHTEPLSWRSAWFSVPIRVASSQCQQGSRTDGKSAHRNASAVVRARIAQSQSTFDVAIAEFTKAAALQDALPYTEPPYWYYPVQSLGAALLQAGRVPEAEAQFRSALKQAPANGWSYFGLAQALRARGDEAGMRQIESALAKTWVGNRELLQLPRLLTGSPTSCRAAVSHTLPNLKNIAPPQLDAQD